MANVYDIGDLVTLSATFKNNAGTLTDPTTVIFRIKDPSGTVTSPSPIKDSTGLYHYDLSITLAGTYWYHFEGTGLCQDAEEAYFTVRKSQTV